MRWSEAKVKDLVSGLILYHALRLNADGYKSIYTALIGDDLTFNARKSPLRDEAKIYDHYHNGIDIDLKLAYDMFPILKEAGYSYVKIEK